MKTVHNIFNFNFNKIMENVLKWPKITLSAGILKIWKNNYLINEISQQYKRAIKGTEIVYEKRNMGLMPDKK